MAIIWFVNVLFVNYRLSKLTKLVKYGKLLGILSLKMCFVKWGGGDDAQTPL